MKTVLRYEVRYRVKPDDAERTMTFASQREARRYYWSLSPSTTARVVRIVAKPKVSEKEVRLKALRECWKICDDYTDSLYAIGLIEQLIKATEAA